MKKSIFIIWVILQSVFSLFSDRSDDKTANEIMKNLPDFLKPTDGKLKILYNFSDTTLLALDKNLDLLYHYPDDKFYPAGNLLLQINSFFPVNKLFSVGPSLFNDTYFKIFENESSGNPEFQFNSAVLAGLNFLITPIHPVLKIPFLLLLFDFGFACEINNIENDGDGLRAKPGGYSSQLIVLPLFPVHLFIMDLNILSLLAVKAALGWMPGINNRNILLLKFKFTDFFNKKIGIGLRIKNIFNFILTGKPDIRDLTSQYTYNRFETTFFYGGVKGLEIHTGYGFEYITFAREPEFYIAHKLVNEISFKISSFKIAGRYLLMFWDSKLNQMNPSHQFELSLGFTNLDL